jgi:hypothetical protein
MKKYIPTWTEVVQGVFLAAVLGGPVLWHIFYRY